MSINTVDGATSSLGKIKISQNEKRSGKGKKSEPVESWEDEAEESSDSSEADGTATPVRPRTSDLPHAPPPTPSSPTSTREGYGGYQSFQTLNYAGAFDPDSFSHSSTSGPRADERRPDKTTSVASRLIAAGIGQKAPKRTAEQREYDQAMKLQEKKKRDQAKEEEERRRREKEKARNDIWGD